MRQVIKFQGLPVRERSNKPFNDKQLLTSVKMAFRHFNKESINRLDLLSHREKEIAKHLTDGLSNKQIGESLFISEDTVKTPFVRIICWFSHAFKVSVQKVPIARLAKPPKTEFTIRK